ncbi:8434_t:CDS:2, partial [Gigaspora rosea]
TKNIKMDNYQSSDFEICEDSKFIQETQINAINQDEFLEWIPFNELEILLLLLMIFEISDLMLCGPVDQSNEVYLTLHMKSCGVNPIHKRLIFIISEYCINVGDDIWDYAIQ